MGEKEILINLIIEMLAQSDKQTLYIIHQILADQPQPAVLPN